MHTRAPEFAASEHQPSRPLTDFARPSVAVDTAVVALDTERQGLAVLLTRQRNRTGTSASWRLPGTFIHPGETLQRAAIRALSEKAGVNGLMPQQLHTFDNPARDERGWVITVAHFDLVRADQISTGDDARLVSIEALPPLDFDHREIIDLSLERIRQAYRDRPDPFRLLAAQRFPMSDLRHLHEAVAGRKFNSDTFRRSFLPDLIETGEYRQGVRGKPARLYELSAR